MRLVFKSFDSKMASREKIFKAVVDFANKIDRKDLINLTHSEDRDNIVVTIWYWTDEPDRGVEMKARQREDLARTPQIAPSKLTHQGTGNPDAAPAPTRHLADAMRRSSELRPPAEEPPADEPSEQ